VKKTAWPAANLAQGRSLRSGERSPLAQAVDSHLIEITTEALGGFLHTRLGEPSSPERGHPSLGLRLQHHTKALMRSHLGKRLSPERGSALLKTRALRLSESSSVTLVCFCKSRLGESVPLGRVSPAWARALFFLQQPHIRTQTTIQAFHYSTTAHQL